MSSANDSPGARIQSMWRRLSGKPGGRWLFNRLLGHMVPYTGSMGATVVHLEPGHARVQLRDRRKVRNHLRSVHAIAMANLGELTTGLALVGALPPTVRGIPTHIEIRYVKKARGLLVAECHTEIPEVTEPMDQVVEAPIKDPSGDVVATVAATWRLSPVAGDRS